MRLIHHVSKNLILNQGCSQKQEHSNLLKRPPVVFISGVSDVKSSSSLDHFAVLCYLNVNRHKTINTSVKFQAFRNIPVPDYRNDVKLLMCNRRKPQKNIDDLINNYNSTLQKLTDKYAPLQCKTIPLRPHAPWYKSALCQEKRVRRRWENGCANDAGSWPTDSSGYAQEAKWTTSRS